MTYIPTSMKSFLMPANVDTYPEQEGMYTLNASNEQKPNCFDRKGNQIEASTLIYPGCYINLSIGLWCYKYKGTYGAAANFLGWQFYKEGTPLSNTASQSDFQTYGEDLEESPLG